MNNVVWKYTLPHAPSVTEINVPANYEVLAVAIQNGAICLWLLVNPNLSDVSLKVLTVGTGRLFNLNGNSGHAGSVVDDASGQAWHVFVSEA